MPKAWGVGSGPRRSKAELRPAPEGTTPHSPRSWVGGSVLKIYTKTGDQGETGLFGGGRVPKDDRRVTAYGEVDELNAALGLALALEPRAFARDLLELVQRDLFTIGAELASPDPAKLGKALPGPRLGDARVEALEDAIDRAEATLAPLKNFILPAGSSTAPALVRDACRAARYVVITDSHVNALYGGQVATALRDAKLPGDVLEFPAGEWNKTRETWASLADRMLALGCGRGCAVIAVGGGVV